MKVNLSVSRASNWRCLWVAAACCASLTISMLSGIAEATAGEAPQYPAWAAELDGRTAVLIPEFHNLRIGPNQVPAHILDRISASAAIGLEVLNPADVGTFLRSQGHRNSPAQIIGEAQLQALLSDIPVHMRSGPVADVVGRRELWNQSDSWFFGLLLFSTLRAMSEPPHRGEITVGETMSQFVRKHGATRPLLALDSANVFLQLWDSCADKEKTTEYIKAAIEDGVRRDIGEQVDARQAKASLLKGRHGALENWAVSRSSVQFLRIHDECIVESRNPGWIDAIEAHLKHHRNVVYVVGVLHLFGKHGLIEGLRGRGFRVEPIEI